MKILVTGGAGFIGSNLIRILINQQHQVLNLDKLTYAGNLQSLSDVESTGNYSFRQIDITNRQAVSDSISEFEPDAIMHLAAESHVDRSIENPGAFIDTNVVGTLVLLEAATKYWKSLPSAEAANFRFLHCSTDEVFGSLGETGFFTEQTSYDPRSPYSASKAASDHLVRAWHHTYGLPVVITNCSNNYGPFQFPEKLIPVVILNAVQNKPIPVYGQGLNVRDWLYVEDHCHAMILAVTSGIPGETYNIGGNNELKNIELVQLLCKILDELRPKADESSYSSQITFVEDRPGHDLRYAIDASKLKLTLGWSPAQDRASGFKSTVQWYLDNEPWWQQILSGEYRLQRQGLLH